MGLAELENDLQQQQGQGLAKLDADLAAASPVRQYLQRHFLEPWTELGRRVTTRLGESGEAVLSLPGLAYKWATGQAQGGLQDVITGQAKPVTAGDVGWTALRALGAPFEPIFAPIGETFAISAERFGASPGTARLIGTGAEMGAGFALPFIKTAPTTVGRGLQSVGIGRTPAETLQAERAIQLARGLPPQPVTRLDQAVDELKTIEAATAKPNPPPVVPSEGGEVAKLSPNAPPWLKQAWTGGPREVPLREAPAGGVELPPVVATETATATMTRPVLKLDIHQKAVNAAEEVLQTGQIVRGNRPLSDAILEGFQRGMIRSEDLDRILANHGLNDAQFAQEMFRPAVADAARRLQTLSALQQRINALSKASPEARKDLGVLLDMASDIDESVRGQSWWRRADNVRRGLLVSQLSTAMRNAETQAGRVGLDVMQQALDAGLQRLFLPGGKPATDPGDAFLVLSRLLSRGNKQQVDSILQAFPAQYNRLFGTIASDVMTKAGGSKIEQATGLLNAANKFQEFTFRRAVFLGRLEQNLKRRGLDLGEVLTSQRQGILTEEDIRPAVQSALEMTWAENPRYGGMGHAFINAVNKIPGATFLIPFPRFLVNSMKFLWDFSPAGALKLFSKAERQAFAAGDTKAISRAMIGSGMLFGAYELRNSDLAGERWYEARLPADVPGLGKAGQTVDLRPFNPFAAYLFAADVLKRYKEGTLASLDTKDIAMGILSSNIRAGTGLYILDRALESIAGLGDREKVLQRLKEFAGEVAGGFATPLQQIRDVVAEYDKSFQVVRETRTEDQPFLGPIKERLPIHVGEGLPLAYSPTRSGPILREAPLAKQLTGLQIGMPKNAAEKELDRLDFRRRDILPTTGIPDADNLIAKHMGPMVEKALPAILRLPNYRQASNPEKSLILDEALDRIRRAATQQAQAERPDLFARIRVEKLPERRRRVIEERVGQTLPALIRERMAPRMP